MKLPSRDHMAGTLAGKMKAVKHAFSSRQAFMKAIEVENTLVEGEARYMNPDPQWMNVDLEPTPPEKQTWGFKTYVLFYFGLSFGNWSLGSAMIGIGLNWWQALIVIFVSQSISALVMAFNSRAATMYHVGYPAVCRMIFGFWASYYFVGSRAVLAAVWYGIQLYNGASHVSNMLRAIFGDSFKNIPNMLPESAGITTSRMLSFFIFWVIHLVFCFFRPYQLRKFFWFKGFIMIPAVLGVFIYCMIETEGKVGHKLPQRSGSGNLGWFIMHAINSGMGNTATLITNQPDIARWSYSKHAPATTGLLVKPLSVTLSASFGILATAGINGKWGLELWNPWDLLDAIQDHHNSSAARFAIFLAAFTWTIGILGTNIAANMIAFGSDVSLLVPRYVDMKRGFFIVQFLSWAIVPWKIMQSAQTFTSFLAGYGLFMASVAAIMVAEYFFPAKGNMMTAWLFDPRKTNQHYRYHKGWNLQALFAYLAGIALPFPGFCVSLGAPSLGPAAQNLFNLGWLLSFFTSFVLYVVVCRFWPTKNHKIIQERGMGFEEQLKLQQIEADTSDSLDGSGPSVEPVMVEAGRKKESV